MQRLNKRVVNTYLLKFNVHFSFSRSDSQHARGVDGWPNMNNDFKKSAFTFPLTVNQQTWVLERSLVFTQTLSHCCCKSRALTKTISKVKFGRTKSLFLRFFPMSHALIIAVSSISLPASVLWSSKQSFRSSCLYSDGSFNQSADQQKLIWL